MAAAWWLLLALLPSLCAPQQVAVASVLVEGLPSPLGLPTLTPRFSLLLAAPPPTRNVSLVAYELELRAGPTPAAALVWASGRLPSTLSLHLPGPPPGVLAAGRAYYVSARALTTSSASQQPAATPFSPPSRFATGLQSRSDWGAGTAFIGLGSGSPLQECPWLTTTFSLSAADLAALRAGTASALLHVASVGYHEATLNGVRLEAEAVLVPSVTDLGRRVAARTYDAAPALREGVNALGLWLAPGWAQFEGVNPVMSFNVSRATIAAAELRLPSGTVATNASWAARASTTRHLGAWTNSNFGGDAVDWRRDVPGWDTPAAAPATAAWERAAEFALPAGLLVAPEAVLPTRVSGSVPAVAVASCGPNCWNVTMAQLFTGWLRIGSLQLPPNASVTLSYSSNAGVEEEYSQQDALVTGLGGGESGGSVGACGPAPALFCGRFSYHEIRFVTLRVASPPGALPSAPPLAAFTGLQLRDGRPRVGAFASSSALLNAQYQAHIATYEGLAQGGMTVDCPHRERLGYGGDGHTSLELALATYGSGATGAFFRHWARAWGDVAGWDGQAGSLPHTAPTVDGGGGPAWGGFAVVAPWEAYLVTGDAEALGEALPTMLGFLGFLARKVDPATGLLAPYGGAWGFLGDWLAPWGSDQSGTPGSVLFNSAYYVYITRLAARAAQALDQPPALVASLTAAADAGAGAVHAAFFNASSGAYGRGLQTDIALPLLAGVPPTPAEAALALRALELDITVTRAGHLNTGLHGSYFLPKLLSALGRDDLVATMLLQTSAPSYGALLAAGYTTWPEAWGGAASRMHACFLGFSLWFNQGVLGVRSGAPGFAAFAVRPAYGVGGVSWARGTTASPLGAIDSSWALVGSALALNVSVPANAAATLYIPAAAGPGSVTEGGAPARLAPGVRFLRQEGNNTVWLVGSGSFAFLAAA
jgi:alpha-L-rhamnosidase